MSQPQSNPANLQPKGLKCVSMICPLIHPLIAKYIGSCKPEFTSDLFKQMFMKGLLSYELFKSKENNKINISSLFSFNNFSFEGLNIQFPDEKVFLLFECQKGTIVFDYRNWHKEKLESFVNYVISQISHKTDPLVNRAIKSAIDAVKKHVSLDNFKIDINNIEIIFRFNNKIECTLSVKKVYYAHKEQKGEIKGIGIKLTDININQSWDILHSFNVGIVYNEISRQINFELQTEIKLFIKDNIIKSIESLYYGSEKHHIKGNESNVNVSSNNNNVLYENIDKGDNIDFSQYNFDVISLLKNSKLIIEKRLIEKKENEVNKKPINFFGFSWGKKVEENKEVVKITNEEQEKIQSFLNNDFINKFINCNLHNEQEKKEQVQNENNKDNNLRFLNKLTPIFEFNKKNIQLIIECKNQDIKNTFKLDIANIIYDNKTSTIEFNITLFEENNNVRIITPTFYQINIEKGNEIKSSKINVNFDSLIISIPEYLHHQIKHIYNLISKLSSGCIKLFKRNKSKNKIKDKNQLNNYNLHFTFKTLKLISFEKESLSYIQISNSSISIIPSLNDNTQSIKTTFEINQIEFLINSNSFLFLKNLKTESKAPENNNKKVHTILQLFEINLRCPKIKIIYDKIHSKINFALNSLYIAQNIKDINISLSSFNVNLESQHITLTETKEIKMKYDFSTNNIIITIPSFTINITHQTLNISINAITFDLNINFANKNINYIGNFTKIIIEYNNLKFTIETLKIGKTIESNLDVQIEDLIIQLKTKTLCQEKCITINSIKNQDNKKQEINFTCTNLIISITQTDLHDILLLIKIKEFISIFKSLSNKLKSSTQQTLSFINNCIFNIKLNCININFFLFQLTSPHIVEYNQQKILNLSLSNTLYTNNPAIKEKSITVESITCVFTDSLNKTHVILSQSYETTDKTNLISSSQFNKKQLIISKIKECITITISSLQYLLRLDALLFLYYFIYNSIPFTHVVKEIKTVDFELNVKINFLNMNFLIQSDIHGNNYFSIDIPLLTFAYESLKGKKFPYGFISILIDNFQVNSVSIKNNNHYKRAFISSKQNEKQYLNLSIEINSLTQINIRCEVNDTYISILYSNLISLFKAYQFNKFYIQNEKRISINSFMDQMKIDTHKIVIENKLKQTLGFDYKKSTINLKYICNSLIVTLINDAKKKYFPFMKCTMTNLLAQSLSDNIKIHVECNIDSYNYIALIWEPIIENCNIISLLKISIEQNITKYSLHTEIESLSINISDMNLSSIFVELSNWTELFQSELKKYEIILLSLKKIDDINNKDELPQMLVSSKNLIESPKIISNNTVMNYSCETIIIEYNNKDILLNPLGKIDLEYETHKENRFIKLKYQNEAFAIPLEKIGTKMHRINGDCYFISDTVLTKERTIDINIYSPIIIFNQTNSKLQIIFKPSIDASLEDPNIIIFLLEQNHQQGIPFSLISNPIAVFNFMTINDSSDYYSLDEVIYTPLNESYTKHIHFNNEKETLHLKMINDIHNVRTLIIGYEYSIVNALPFTLSVSVGKKFWIIEKGMKKNIDAKKDDIIRFEIVSDNNIIFVSESKIFQELESQNENKDKSIKFIKFQDTKKRVLNINSIFTSKKELILCAEFIIKNESDIPLEILQEGPKIGSKTNFIYFIESNIYLVSSKDDIDKCSVCFTSSAFKSDKIVFESFLRSSSKINIKLKNNNTTDIISLRVRNKISHITIYNDVLFKEILTTRIFSIIGTCFIFNQLVNKEIVIYPFPKVQDVCEIILPLTKLNFHFFAKNPKNPVTIQFKDIETKQTHCVDNFVLANVSFTTLYLLDCFINIEVRLNNIDNTNEIYIYESNYEKAKIVIDNKSSFNVAIQQVTEENKFQIVESHRQTICKIYDHRNLEFCMSTDNNFIKLKFHKDIKPNIYTLSNKICLQLQTNGIKSKLTFFDKEQVQSITTYLIWKLDFSIDIKHCIISLISDNEFIYNKVNNKYNRNEIALISLNSITVKCNINLNLSFEVNDVNLYIQINSFMITNQLYEKGNFPIFIINKKLLPKSHFFTLNCDFDQYPKDKLSIINNFTFSFDEMDATIDPNFLNRIINFITNISYRTNIIFYDIDDIFIPKSTLIQNNMKLNRTLQQASLNSFLIYASKINLPQIKIDLQISKIGLSSILKKKFNCSSFTCKIMEQLTGHTFKINIDKLSLNSFQGGYNDLFKQITYMYKTEIFTLLMRLGLKGIVFAIQNVFIKKETHSSSTIANHRLRTPRNFYGKYKYIKSFNEKTANIQEQIMTNYLKYPFLKGHHFVDGITLEQNTFLFTTLGMFVFDKHLSHIVKYQVDYFCVQDVDWNTTEERIVNIFLTQRIDNKLMIIIDTNVNEGGKVIGKMLLCYYNIYKDELNNLD